MADIVPPDYGTDVGKLRALIPDSEQLPDENGNNAAYIFSDDHLNVYLGLNSGNIRLAAADALEVLGTTEGFILKVLINQDQQTDGAKLMAQYLARAKQLRERNAAELELLNAADEGSFTIVEFFLPGHAEVR